MPEAPWGQIAGRAVPRAAAPTGGPSLSPLPGCGWSYVIARVVASALCVQRRHISTGARCLAGPGIRAALRRALESAPRLAFNVASSAEEAKPVVIDQSSALASKCQIGLLTTLRGSIGFQYEE